MTPEALRGIVAEHAELKSILAMQANEKESIKKVSVDMKKSNHNDHNGMIGQTLTALNLNTNSLMQESERSRTQTQQIKELSRVRQILIDQLKEARRDLKTSILVNTQAQDQIRARSKRPLKFIRVALAEMSMELDGITMNIYKD